MQSCNVSLARSTDRRKQLVMTKDIVQTCSAPQAIGPYSQAVKAGGFMFVSGQLPLDPVSGQIPSGISAQTRQALENLKAILEAGGSSLDRVVKVNLYIRDMGNFHAINAIYGEYLGDSRPARACVEVNRLPKDCDIEIEAVALV